MNIGRLREINDLKSNNYFLQQKLFSIKNKLKMTLEEIDDGEKCKNTDYYALIGFTNGKPVAIGIYGKDDDSEKIGDGILQQVQIVIPIPDPEHLKEFDGF